MRLRRFFRGGVLGRGFLLLYTTCSGDGSFDGDASTQVASSDSEDSERSTGYEARPFPEASSPAGVGGPSGCASLSKRLQVATFVSKDTSSFSTDRLRQSGA